MPTTGKNFRDYSNGTMGSLHDYYMKKKCVRTKYTCQKWNFFGELICKSCLYLYKSKTLDFRDLERGKKKDMFPPKVCQMSISNLSVDSHIMFRFLNCKWLIFCQLNWLI